MPANQSRGTPRPLWFVIALTMLVVLRATTNARTWGTLDHRAIAQLAEKHMTPEAKASVAALLEPGESMADASLRADRNRVSKTAPWHYVDIRLDEPEYDRNTSADDPRHSGIMDKINEFPLVVMDMSKAVRCSGRPEQAVSRRLPKRGDAASKNSGFAGVLFRAGDLGFEARREALRRYWPDADSDPALGSLAFT